MFPSNLKVNMSQPSYAQHSHHTCGVAQVHVYPMHPGHNTHLTAIAHASGPSLMRHRPCTCITSYVHHGPHTCIPAPHTFVPATSMSTCVSPHALVHACVPTYHPMPHAHTQCTAPHPEYAQSLHAHPYTQKEHMPCTSPMPSSILDAPHPVHMVRQC